MPLLKRFANFPGKLAWSNSFWVKSLPSSLELFLHHLQKKEPSCKCFYDNN